jgi:hypothetical protein
VAELLDITTRRETNVNQSVGKPLKPALLEIILSKIWAVYFKKKLIIPKMLFLRFDTKHKPLFCCVSTVQQRLVLS